MEESEGPEHVLDEQAKLRMAANELTNRTAAVRAKLEQLRERSSTYVPIDDADETRARYDAAEAELEREVVQIALETQEAYERRRTFEQILTRLREESNHYHHEMAEIQQAIKAKEHDRESLQLMVKDASHVRDVAKRELGRIEEVVKAERDEREDELKQWRRKLELHHKSASKHEARSIDKGEQLLIKRDNLIAKSEAAEHGSERKATELAIADERAQIAQLEQRIAVLKAETATTTVQSIIDKFEEQESTRLSLEASASDGERNLGALVAQCAELKKRVEAARYSVKSASRPSSTPAPDASSSTTAPSALAARGSQRRNSVILDNQLAHTNALLLEARVSVEHLANVLEKTAALPAGAGRPEAVGGRLSIIPGNAPAMSYQGSVSSVASSFDGAESAVSSPIVGRRRTSSFVVQRSSPSAQRLTDSGTATSVIAAMEDAGGGVGQGDLEVALAKVCKQFLAMYEAVRLSKARSDISRTESFREVETIGEEAAAPATAAKEVPPATPAVVEEAPLRQASTMSTTGLRARRALALEVAEAQVSSLAAEQGPIFKRMAENMRIPSGDIIMDEDEDEEADPASEPVLDRESVKTQAARLAKKHEVKPKRKANEVVQVAAEGAQEVRHPSGDPAPARRPPALPSVSSRTSLGGAATPSVKLNPAVHAKLSRSASRLSVM